MSFGLRRATRVWLPLTAATLLLGIFTLRRAPFQLDDAFITYRYASNLALHHSLSFNPGDVPVEGFSSPVWMLLLAGCAWLFGKAAVQTCAIVLGFAGACVALGLLQPLSASRSASDVDASASGSTVAATVPLLWLVVTPAFSRYAATGLEHPWFLACILAVAGACAQCLPLRVGVVCAALAPWVRPEGVWVAVASAAQRLATGSGDLRARLRDKTSWAIGLAAGCGQLALSSVRWIVFADIAPNTYWAKPSHLREGFLYVRDVLCTGWGGGIAAAALLGAILGSRLHRGYAVAGVAWLIAACLEGGDWMPDGRLALPGLALLIAAASGCFAGMRRGLAWSQISKSRVLLALGLVVLAMGSALARSRAAIELDLANFRSLGQEQHVLGQWLVAARARSAALVDIGEIGFWGELEIVDLAGLTDRVIAHSPGPRMAKQFDLAYLFEIRRPDVVVLRLWSKPTTAMIQGAQAVSTSVMGGIEQRLAQDPRLPRDYRLLFAQLPYKRLNPYYGRLVYARTGFEPALKTPERVVYVEELPRN